DKVTHDEHSAGALARIRLFDGALSGTEVGALGLLPPKITLTSPQGPAGSVVHVDGTSFGANEVVKLIFDSTKLCGASPLPACPSADVKGVLSTDVTIPANASPGNHLIKAKGGTSGLAKRTFTVAP